MKWGNKSDCAVVILLSINNHTPALILRNLNTPPMTPPRRFRRTADMCISLSCHLRLCRAVAPKRPPRSLFLL
jgi:hypothetical protein